MQSPSSILLKRFATDRRGATAVLFGLMVIPIMGMMALALDFGLLQREQNIQQVAADAGALAAAGHASVGESSEAELIAIAKAVFHENYLELGGSPGAPDPIVTIQGPTVTVTFDRTMNTAILGIFGYDTLTPRVKSVARMQVPDKLELALVLDYSSSMDSNGKYQSMRDTAIQFVEDLTTNLNDPGHKFALVPFARHVYASLPSDYVAGQPSGGTWTNCTQDRQWPHNTMSTTPVLGSDQTKWVSSVDEDEDEDDGGSEPCNKYSSRDLVVTPLTGNHSQIVSQLQDMTPYAGTHIALGLEMGWHVISPNPPFDQAVPYSNNEVRKVIVLLTDGEQTIAGHGPGGSHSEDQAKNNLATLCTNVKAAGIKLVTVGFDLDSQEAKDPLIACASSPSDFYDAGDGAELADSFRDITDSLAGLARLVE